MERAARAADLYVYLNGVRQTPTTHYTVADSGADLNVTFVTAPAATEKVAIHGNTATAHLPEVFTIVMVDSNGDPSEDGGPSESSNWLRVRGPLNNIVNLFVNANSYKYIMEPEGRTDAQTTLQFINRMPFRRFPFVLAQSAEAVSHTGSTSETVLATITVPAYAMGLSGALRVTTQWSYTNSGNNKTPRIRFGGDAGTQFLGNNVTTTASLVHQIIIQNRNDIDAQIGNMASTTSFGASASAGVTSAVDTSVDTTLVISGQLADGGETITLERYMVEVLPKL